MKITTKKDLIRNVATHWKECYGRDISRGSKEKHKIYHALMALDLDKATEVDIARIIGNNSWTVLYCNECDQEVDTIITLGEEENYDSRTATVCPNCLKKAMALLEGIG